MFYITIIPLINYSKPFHIFKLISTQMTYLIMYYFMYFPVQQEEKKYIFLYGTYLKMKIFLIFGLY